MADISGTAGADNLNGSTGNDRIFGGGGDDVIAGGDGSDTIYGEEGSDTLTGGAGLDIFHSGEGNDRIDGGAGNDSVRADAGDDVIEGGYGHDAITFDATGHGVTVDLGQGIAIGEGTDSLSGIERAVGSPHDDMLTGSAYGDELQGGLGSDRLSGGEGSDTLFGGGGGANWFFGSDGSVDWLDGGGGNDGIWINENDNADGGAGIDSLFLSLFTPTTLDLSTLWTGGTAYNGTGILTGFERLQRIIGSSGADTIILGTGSSTDHSQPWSPVEGGGGDDRITGGDDWNWLEGGSGDDVLIGLAGDDQLGGGSGQDRLEGGEGDDWLWSSSDDDVMLGGPGSDTYAFWIYGDGSPAGSIFEDENAAGSDVVVIEAAYGAAVEDGNFVGIRNIEVAQLISNKDLDGAEFVLGTEFQATGIRSLIADADIDGSQVTVGLDIEMMPSDYRDPVDGIMRFAVTGGSGDDVFSVNRYFLPPSNKHFSLDGGPGADTLALPTGEVAMALFGGPMTENFGLVLTGIEVIVLGSADPPPEPTDPYGPSLHPDIFSLVLTDALFAAGERLTIDARLLLPASGGTPADRLILDAGALSGGRALDVHGGPGADDIIAGGGDDLLDGGAGGDTMRGQGGDDVYLLDTAADAIFESADAGIDTVRAGFTYYLPQHVENLVLTGAAPAGGVGNDSVNGLTGNSGDNRLDGRGAADLMAGGEGDDVYVVDDAGDQVIESSDAGTDTVESVLSYVLSDQVEHLVLTGTAFAGTGNGAANAITGNGAANLLNGGGGVDVLTGAGGDDLYVVDVAADLVVELAGGGVDTVRSSVSYALADHVEHLVLTGGGSHQATGNGLANGLTGNNGNNRLDGGAGADTMAGGAGHDVYVVNNAADQVIETGSSGNDTVESAVSYSLPVHVEKLILTGSFGYDGRGNSGANTITGNAGGNFLNGGRGNDLIDGGAGNDWLMGHLGSDRLTGGAGDDRFYFNAAPGSADADRILDFSAGDSLWLLAALFQAGPNGGLAESAFHAGGSAADADDRILYDAATGRLFYDADGTGAADALLFATVDPGTPLTHADFVIYG